jgi:hypothetical protein
MSSGAVTIHFPSGESEYRLSEKTPEIGDVLTRNGQNWVVAEVAEAKDGTSVVTLRPELKLVTPSAEPSQEEVGSELGWTPA